MIDDTIVFRSSKKALGSAIHHQHGNKTNRPDFVRGQCWVTLALTISKGFRPLGIPTLRAQIEDIYPIIKNFITQFNSEFGLDVQGIDPEAWDVHRHCNWPGNIRELRNVIESAFNVVVGSLIMKEHLPGELSKSSSRDMTQSEYAPMQRIEDFICTSLGNKNINEIMDAFEKILIDKALEHCQGNELQAAQLLGLSRPGLYKKLQKHSGESDDSG